MSDPTILASLKVELPSYLAKSADSSPDFNTVELSQHEQDLPQWSSVAKKVNLLQPSSAAGGRVFSLLNSSFSEQHQNSLEDYVECYNIINDDTVRLFQDVFFNINVNHTFKHNR